MIRNFMIISARGGIVLYRAVLTAGLPTPPRLVGGLLTALAEYAARSVGGNPPFALSHVVLGSFSLTLASHRSLLCAVFHDSTDGEAVGRVLAGRLVRAFAAEYGSKVEAVHLAHVGGVEEEFRAFGGRLRGMIDGCVGPVMRHLDRHPLIDHTLLFRPRPGCIVTSLGSLVHVTPTAAAGAASAAAAVSAALAAGADVMAGGGDVAAVIAVGPAVRVHRLPRGTVLVVVRCVGGRWGGGAGGWAPLAVDLNLVMRVLGGLADIGDRLLGWG